MMLWGMKEKCSRGSSHKVLIHWHDFTKKEAQFIIPFVGVAI